MKPAFKTDRGNLIAFCFLWLLLSGELLRALNAPWWIGFLIAWAYVDLSFRVAGAPPETGFVDRFVRAAADIMLLALGVGIILMIGTVLYWGVSDGFTGMPARAMRASEAGLGAPDGRTYVFINGLTWLVAFFGTPLRLRHAARKSSRSA